MLLRMIGEIKESRDHLRCVIVVFLPVSSMYNFSQRVQVIQWMTLAKAKMKQSVILTEHLSPDIFSTLRMKTMKGQACFALRACAFISSGLIDCLECTSD